MLVTDSGGAAFLNLMGRFAMFLAFSTGKGGDLRKRNTVMSYYRNVKNWLLENFPQHRSEIEQQLLKMGRIMERHWLKRQQGGLVKRLQRAPRTTCGLSSMDSTTTQPEKKNTKTLVSDLAFIQKCNLSVSSENVLFLRLVRTKTSDEQGLSLYPDKTSFITCPLHAIAMALAMQTFPNASVLSVKQLFKEVNVNPSLAEKEAPLIEALLHAGDDKGSTPSSTDPPQGPRRSSYKDTLITATTQQAQADITSNLSLRGGAQHANDDSSLSAQWIFDRGNWNMTAINKAFAYVFNTANEDMRVSKVLSDWKSTETPCIPSLSRTRIRKIGATLFASSLGFENASLNVDKHVADMLTAILIQNFPETSDRYPMSPFASRMRLCLLAENVNLSELLPWSVERKRETSQPPHDEKEPSHIQLINHHNAVISQLLETNQELSHRVAQLERRLCRPDPELFQVNTPTIADTHGETPRLWVSCNDQKYKSQTKQIVAFVE
ncbi:LOW QUALITY PROTEIN: hypothetical protein PHMEG_00034729, partial [Phytophthora megakarya]